MLNILKADFKKLLKGKMVYILLIAAIILPIFTAAMIKVSLLLIEESLPELEMFGFSTYELFKQSFSTVNNLGLLLLIMVLVIVGNDFSQRTIRNKIIGGHSKNKIYLSSYILMISVVVIIITVYAFMTYLASGILVSFGNRVFIDYLKVYAVNIFGLIALYTIINFLLFLFKSFGATLGITLAGLFLMTIIYTIFMFVMSEKANNIILTILPFLNTLSNAESTTTEIILKILSSSIYIIGFTFMGLHLNKKLDYK